MTDISVNPEKKKLMNKSENELMSDRDIYSNINDDEHSTYIMITIKEQ